MSAKELDSAALEEADRLLASVKLPSPPRVLAHLNQMLQSGADADPVAVGKLISSDPALMAKTLAIVNSPLYGLTSKVTSAERACALLGPKIMQTSIISSAIRDHINACDIKEYLLEAYWQHSDNVAKACWAIADTVKHKGRADIQVEDAYLMGLFHDCAIPVLLQKNSNYEALMQESKDMHQDICEFEHEESLLTHADVGFFITKRWGLADDIRDALHYHHLAFSELVASPSVMIYVYILALAEYMVSLIIKEQVFDLEYRSQRDVMQAMKGLDLSVADLKHIQSILMVALIHS